jgi:hypothetical protein
MQERSREESSKALSCKSAQKSCNWVDLNVGGGLLLLFFTKMKKRTGKPQFRAVHALYHKLAAECARDFAEMDTVGGA